MEMFALSHDLLFLYSFEINVYRSSASFHLMKLRGFGFTVKRRPA